MKQILWFRRDLRINDSAILENAQGEVLPIFIFDKNILGKLPKNDKRVTFIFNAVQDLKKQLQKQNLDLKIFYDEPINVFKNLEQKGFDEILTSIDFDDYAKNRDKEVEEIIPLKRYLDSFILDPNEHFTKSNTPYKVFTPFFKSLENIWASNHIKEYKINKNLKLFNFDYSNDITLEKLGFIAQELPQFLLKSADELIEEFSSKIKDYEKNRDYFYLDGTSKLSVHLRFGLISPKEVFNKIKKIDALDSYKEFFIKELFWREFYNYILYHFPKSEFENFNEKQIIWEENDEHFKAWCDGKTGVPIIDASMRKLNKDGVMHNRLRMIVSSFLTKNLLIDWKKGEEYFALKLLDYEASSNIGSWQWAASTGADAVPYFRVFNPYTQSKKFDKEAKFIKENLSELKNIEAKLIHEENKIDIKDYPSPIVNISISRNRAIKRFKEAT